MTRSDGNNGRVIALFGTESQIGRALYPRLAASTRIKKIVALDLKPRSEYPGNAVSYRIDLSRPEIFAPLVQIFEKEGVDTVVHMAFLNHPKPDDAYIHDFESIGTMQILAAAAEAGISKLIVQSSSFVYGALHDNPIYLTEQHPLRGDKRNPLIREMVDVERQIAAFARNHPDICTTVLRMATIMGADADNYLWKHLKFPAVTTVMGYDPLWQGLSVEDAVAAFMHITLNDLPGAYNYAAPGVLPISEIVDAVGGVRVPVPYHLLKAQLAAMRLAELTGFHSRQLEFFRYSCLADCTRAYKALGIRPQSTIAQVLASA